MTRSPQHRNFHLYKVGGNGPFVTLWEGASWTYDDRESLQSAVALRVPDSDSFTVFGAERDGSRIEATSECLYSERRQGVTLFVTGLTGSSGLTWRCDPRQGFGWAVAAWAFTGFSAAHGRLMATSLRRSS